MVDDERMHRFRRFFRWFMSIFTAGLVVAFGIVFGTVFRQNIEVLAEEYGIHAYLVGGWRMITDLGLASWLLYGIFFSSGASVALWVDYWMRRWTEKKATISANETEFWMSVKDGWTVDYVPVLGNVHHWHVKLAGPSATLYLGFDRPVEKGHILVASTSDGLKWREDCLSDRHVVIEFEGRTPDSEIYVAVVSETVLADRRRQQAGVFQPAATVPSVAAYMGNSLALADLS
ncbi:hypothetical protein GGE65_001274 [Skermanella aerolata]|uniref:hypothetical protein n=1 Tax=Skermanella aerolata TaxID=393310 RepID=UPI003D1BE890